METQSHKKSSAQGYTVMKGQMPRMHDLGLTPKLICNLSFPAQLCSDSELPWLLYLSNGFTFFFVNSSHILRRKTHGITCFYISYFLISKIIIILFSVPEYFACMNACASQVCLVVFKDVQRGWGSDTLNLKLQAIMSHHVGAENGNVLCKSSECSQPQHSLSNSQIACFFKCWYATILIPSKRYFTNAKG